MTRIAEIDMRELTVTPVFKIIEVENVPKSEAAGHPVMETIEVVEVRLAGNKNYSPIFPTGAFWQRQGNNVITYAERWPDQYRQFKEGSPQEANGTPLEMLRQHGVTPEQLSLCRALRIYSIEALHHLEGPPVKALGMSANSLKAAARAFLADRDKGLTALSRIEELERELAAFRASKAGEVPEKEPTPEEVDEALQAADAAYAGLSDDQLKERIAEKAGARPRGNPSRATLERTMRELEAA